MDSNLYLFVSFQQQALKPAIESEDLLLVKKNLRQQKIDVADEDIEQMYRVMHDNKFLKMLYSKAQQCEKLYGLHVYNMDADVSYLIDSCNELSSNLFLSLLSTLI